MNQGVVAITFGSPGTREIDPGDHLVQFYADENELARFVGGYLLGAAEAGAGSIVIATPEHRRAFQKVLAAAPCEAHRLPVIWRDARDTLGQLMSGDHPDPAKFDDVIGGLVRSTLGTHPVRAYGEMVALLWEAGNIEGAIELEALWNRLGHELRFALLCAYPSQVVSGTLASQALLEVRGSHSAAIDPPPRELSGDYVFERFTPDSTTPAAARRLVTDTLRRWGSDPRAAADAELIISELSTNAIVHGGTELAVLITRGSTGIRIEVTDAGGGIPRREHAEVTANSGRGLAIVDVLAARWGVDYCTRGKTVWAEVGELDGHHGGVIAGGPATELD
jgi:hypothetical protein